MHTLAELERTKRERDDAIKDADGWWKASREHEDAVLAMSQELYAANQKLDEADCLAKFYQQLKEDLEAACDQVVEERRYLDDCLKERNAQSLSLLRERDEARAWAIRLRDQLGYQPEEWHQHIERFKVDYDDYMKATDRNQWPDWLKEGYDRETLESV